MASMSRFALNTAPRLCLLKSTTTTTAFTTTSLIGKPNTSLSYASINNAASNQQNTFKKSITTLKSAAAVSVGFSTTGNCLKFIITNRSYI